MKLGHFGLLVASFVSAVQAAGSSTFSPARPPALPLAVRAPYMNTWQEAGSDGGNGGYLAGQWPTFWSGHITGWSGIVRVDGHPFTWMGGIPNTNMVNQVAYEYTSTKSVFTMHVDNKVEMNVTFLSPVTPDDFRRQSLVSSYLHVDVASMDGSTHNVQLYSDISAEWASGDRNAVAEWDYGVTDGGIAYHKVHRQTQLLFSEISSKAEWGNWYWATESHEKMTHQSGSDVNVRGKFSSDGRLDNSKDTNYRPVSQDWPVFAFAVDLGFVDSTPASTLFTIGLYQTDAIQYNAPSGERSVPSLWTDYFSDEPAAVQFFYNDYSSSNSLCSELDTRVAKDAVAAAGENFFTAVTLTVRQAFGAVQLCGTRDKPYVFMKEISSNGNMNTVDVIFPTHPIFLYTNPEFLNMVLRPVYEIQESGRYPNTYAMHDIGTHYPNATGHPDGKDEKMPLEECGNMVLMALAYAQKTGNTGYLQDHYPILMQWSGYLVEDALYPDNQISTDDFAGPLANQTNLALKGMIGLEAMSVISDMTGHPEHASKHTRIAHDYIKKWQSLGVNHEANPPHSTLSYGDPKSHGLLYNLYADRELGLNLVPQWVYDMQSSFYPTVEGNYGVPLDTRHGYTKGDWECFVAAIASTETRDMFFKDLAVWINETPTNWAMTDLYDTMTGDYPGITFVARPVMGGAFALLLLDD